MKKIGMNRLFMVMAILLVTFASCKKDKIVSPIYGHWGVEKYVSCRTDSLDAEHWDTLCYTVGTGHGYEITFNDDGTAKLLLNDSPAFIKEFTCSYSYDADQQDIIIHGSAWQYAIYGSLYLDENEACFNVETLNDSTLVASWTNSISEPAPFFERFFLKTIE